MNIRSAAAVLKKTEDPEQALRVWNAALNAKIVQAQRNGHDQSIWLEAADKLRAALRSNPRAALLLLESPALAGAVKDAERDLIDCGYIR